MGKKLDAIGVLFAATLVSGLPVGVAAAEADQAAEEAGQAPTRPAPTDEMKAWDVLTVRPISFVSSVFSTGVFVLTIPFSALDPAVDIDKSRENLVQYPFRDTFQRPLGDFSGDRAFPPDSGDSPWSLPTSPGSAETAPELRMSGGDVTGGKSPAATTAPYAESPAAPGGGGADEKKDKP